MHVEWCLTPFDAHRSGQRLARFPAESGSMMVAMASASQRSSRWGSAVATAPSARRAAWATRQARKSVVSGKGVSVRVDHGGRRYIKKKSKIITRILVYMFI